MTPATLPTTKPRTDVNPARIYTLTIDGKDVSGREDETILTVARQNNIYIPTLCHLDGLAERGACRLCIVEVKGSPKLFAACVTLVTQDMEVITNSERIRDYRRKILELIFSERNHVCSVCVVNGNCELQNLAVTLGMTHVRYEYLNPPHRVDASHPRFSVDHNRCVLCLRCIRVCKDIEGAHTWDIMGRGIRARDHLGSQSALGFRRDLHRLRKMRSGMPHGRPVGKRKVRCGNDQTSGVFALSSNDEKGSGTMSRPQMEPSKKLRLATVWLDGCSGCHMSLLDIDERLVAVAGRLDIVYSPIVDTRVYPEAVDVCLVEGAVSTQEDVEKLHMIRKNTRLVVSFGDCAVTANVPGMRNRFKLQDVLSRAYLENVTHHPRIPGNDIPALFDTVRPVHAFIDVDLFLPGCPPSGGCNLFNHCGTSGRSYAGFDRHGPFWITIFSPGGLS